MSVHKECGEPIRWAKRDDDTDKFLPPLQSIGEVYILDEDGVGRRYTGYINHQCDLNKVAAWQEYQEKLARLKENEPVDTGMNAWEVAKQRREEQIWSHALRVECERCQALVDEKCRNLSKRYIKTGEIVHTVNPHESRIDAATAQFGEPE